MLAQQYSTKIAKGGGPPTNTFKAMSRIRHIERREAADKHIQRREWTTNTLNRREAADKHIQRCEWTTNTLKRREAANFFGKHEKAGGRQ